MTEYIDFPVELFEGVSSLEEQAARMGRFMVLQELGFFGTETNLDLAQGHYKGRFNGGVRKRFAGIFNDVAGCHPGDIECVADMLGVFDSIYDYELQDKNGAT